ncbi:paired amphipathic helix protein Sin3-like 5 isoform X2 [Zea mays]|uniref:Paired amphipathic helix protein Sin3-like 3 n=1 Tax=Zea mays TaxID=4577 RepID=A0A1D6LIT0_MAIZE|nr:paired amphipathic helix protein Sin3-like 5 isoform X2 [Zea mays]AQK79686.1 Paired amphipathic helix protein Sin3-like 3 [Zea mays]AQK79687.1 Paired amphipathic helix protein Sin3-like 3 [Zea mays]|eukprot:XP_020395824.1 paired amphipathic helix protein Sin3-like 5 isoform X2 [Zea mays]
MARRPPPSPPPPAQGNGSGSGSLTTRDALAYLKAVKDKFQEKRHTYEQFIQVMRDFKSDRLDSTGVIARVKTIFHGYPDLILGFNAFLPKEHAIRPLDLREDKKPVDYPRAISLVNRIKSRFQQEEHVYKSFLGILNKYRMHNKPIQDVYNEVTALLHGHPDLLEEFSHFLPDTPMPPPQAGTTTKVRHDDNNAIMHSVTRAQTVQVNQQIIESPVFNSKSQTVQRGRDFPSTADWDTSADRLDLEHDIQKSCIEKEKIRDACPRQHRRGYKRNEKNDEYENEDLDVEQCGHKSQRKMEGTGDDTPGDATLSSFNCSHAQEFQFCEKLKAHLEPEAYQEFLKCLHIYNQDIITRNELKRLVKDILQHYPDLVNGFNDFLGHCENIDGFLEGTFNKRQTSRMVRPVEKERYKENEGDSDPEKERYKESKNSERVLTFNSKEGAAHEASTFPSKEKYNLCKPISELDLSNCQRCTPSYRLLPKNYPVPSASNRTDTEASVLNDRWVSVTSGSEDYSFKHMRKNQYEESLFRCEDDMFELDMLLESVTVAIERVEKLVERMEGNSLKPDSSISLDEHLTSLNMRCIERLYGDHGLDVIDVLRKNVGVTLPVILTRLKQKQEEWSRCQSDFNKVWAEVYSKNYHKSLDHRSFYFKQQDTKNLNTKALLSQIKEISEKNRKGDDVLLAIAAGNRWPLVANMSFVYLDMDIHEDLYQIIKYSCGELCNSSDQVNKVMRIWTTFLEPLLGIHHRAHGAEDADMVKSKRRTREVGLACGGKTNNAAAKGGNGSKSAGAESVAEFMGRNETIPSMKSIKHDRITSLYGVGVHPFSAYSVSHNNLRPETEEGELSPNGDFKEEHFCVFEDEAVDGTSKQNEGSTSRSPQGRPKNYLKFSGKDHSGAENEGNKRAQRSAEDSENASEADEDISGSESAGDEESSHEDQEEEEDDMDLDTKAKNDCRAEVNREAQGLDGGTSLSFSECLQSTVKPISKYVSTALPNHEKKLSHIFYGNDSFYVLFRLHQIFYERILSAKTNCSTSDNNWKASRHINSPDQYSRFISALYNLLDGSSDHTKFEDDCRSIIGTQSYVLFTIDKLIYKIVKQLQALASDEMDNQLLQLYLYEKSRSPGSFFDLVYHENARALLHDDNIYRFECHSDPTELTIQLMEYGNEKPELTAVSFDPTFSPYLYNGYLSSIDDTKLVDDVFLRRNKRKQGRNDDSPTSLKIMDNVMFANGLECKISCESSKVSYVLDTEDVLFRTRKRRSSI